MEYLSIASTPRPRPNHLRLKLAIPVLIFGLTLWGFSAEVPGTVGLTRPYVQYLLNVTDEAWETYEHGAAAGHISLTPVSLPTRLQPPGDNNHLSWPVAVQAGSALVVVHRRIPGHNALLAGKADENSTYTMIVRSLDGGESWSPQYDIRNCMRYEDRSRGGSTVPLAHRYKFDPDNESPLGYKLHLNAIGTTRNGAIVVASNYGVFRSTDLGASWEHLRLAFREDSHTGPFVYVGPRMIDHPSLGLLLFGHHVRYRAFPEAKPTGARPAPWVPSPDEILTELAVYRSQDEGGTWENITQKLPDWCRQAEPDVILHDGVLHMMARNQTTRHLVQLQWRPGEAIKARDTNMVSARSVDTSDLCFNPITGRFEVVQSNRTDMSIHLYSLAPEDWESGMWRHEAELFKRRSGSFYSSADGFHTGGAVVDVAAKRQHIFIYTGYPGGPAGVFKLTRTLETPFLQAYLRSRGSD